MKRVHSVGWNFTGLPGCCSGTVLYSLGGSYLNHTGWMPALRDKNTRIIGTRAPKAPLTWTSGANGNSASWLKRFTHKIDSIPMTWAYAALMDIARNRGGGASLVYLSDNVMAHGSNQHHGEFSCRHFARWLKKTNTAHVVESHSVNGNHRDNVAGWICTFKGDAALTRRQDATLRRYRKAHEDYQAIVTEIFPDRAARIGTARVDTNW